MYFDFKGIGKALHVMFALCIIFIPLGIWKLIDIIIWVYRNVHIKIGN